MQYYSDVRNVNSIQNNISFTAKQKRPPKNENSVHNYKKYLAVAATVAGAIALGAGIVHFAKKGKIKPIEEPKILEIPEVSEIPEIPEMPEVSKISEISDIIDFLNKDGVAYKKGSSELFTGEVKKSLKDGSEVILEYKNGFIQKASKEGENSFEKLFLYDEENVLKIVGNTINDKTEVIDITKLKNAANDFADLVKDKDEFHAKELSTLFYDIEHGSKLQEEAQNQKIDSIIEEKMAKVKKLPFFKRLVYSCKAYMML